HCCPPFGGMLRLPTESDTYDRIRQAGLTKHPSEGRATVQDADRWVTDELAKLAKRVDIAISSKEPYRRDPALDILFEKSKRHTMTAREFEEQCINWVWGQAVDMPEELRPSLDEVRSYLRSPDRFLR